MFKRYYRKGLAVAGSYHKKALYKLFRFMVVDHSGQTLHIRSLAIPRAEDPITNYKCENYLNHRYDILGSGWFNNACTSDRKDYESTINRRILSRVSSNYAPHDWYKDFKSGFVWSDKEFCKDALKWVGRVENMDIKFPWEMSRLQHLPVLALGSQGNSACAQEIKDQLTDFYYSNPVGIGVNWSCTMDVGIRIHNILLAVSMCQLEKDAHFDRLLSKLISEHGNFIFSFLENKAYPNNNHYLSNLLGLISIAYFTEPTAKTKKWGLFAYNQFLKEFDQQFHADGSNFEGSSCYHALSSEIYLLFTAYALGFQDSMQQHILKETHSTALFSKAYIEKLHKAGLFIRDLSFNNGELVQIGDNDSGFIFKLSNSGRMLQNGSEKELYESLNTGNYTPQGQDYWDENMLCKKHLLERFSVLFPDISTDPAENDSIEKQWMLSVLKGASLQPVVLNKQTQGLENSQDFDLSRLTFKKEHTFQLKKEVKGDIRLFNYPHFGVCGYKSSDFELIFSYADNGLHGKGGHAHNDKMSFSLAIDNQVLFSDPGTYTYHPSPDWRNYFRSTKAHNTIYVAPIEQNAWAEGRKGIFRLSNDSRCALLRFDKEMLMGHFANDAYEHVRTITIKSSQIIVTDYCNCEFATNFTPNEFFSPGYGKLIRNSH